MNGWPAITSAVAGFGLGAAGSLITKQLADRRSRIASSWWFGAFATALVLTILAWRVGARGELPVYAFVLTLGIPLSIIDWLEHRLPRIVVVPQLVGAALGLALLCVARSDPAPGLRALWAMLAAASFYLLLAVLVEGGVGSGDVGLAAVVGLVTGWVGWAELAGAVVLASLVALALLLVPRLRASRAVPFGPCLLVAMAVTLAVAS
ncbi:prepilin peptidase [Amycolatopsis sp. FBCC-B4732]|uniref:prepilin peptidase n=1 Tax=Amycolatopsis sp. FBCC-B4732 TaxID=3079339 RepID=UPI001FF4DF4A|nr:prepilin peptidase [Amycolatopsis sp. FBCC-B4732]UOX88395.1 prepilin peptidase [Amycolatopsis sp. FBCC-B4732]